MTLTCRVDVEHPKSDPLKYTDLFIDFDDTLYDTHGNATLALHELYAHFGLSRYFDDFEQFSDPYWRENLALWSQYSRGEIERDFLIVERFRRPLSIGMGEKATPAFCMEVSDWFLECCADKPGVIEGAHDVVAYLRRRGYRLHLCSNGFHEVQYRKLRASGLDGQFETVILSEDAGANKPARAFFDYAMKVSRADLTKTLMIGDNFETDIQGARAYGLDVMFFNHWSVDFKAPEPVDYEIHTLREIIDIL